MSNRRWVYTQGGQPLPEPVEVTDDWRNTGLEGGRKSEEEVYGNVSGPKGEDLSTRRRHREYMQHNGLALADDFTNHWQQAAKERADFYTTGGSKKARRESIERAMYQVMNKKRRG